MITIRRTAVVAAPTPTRIRVLHPTCTHRRIDLFNSMANGNEITIMSKPDGKFHTGTVTSIAREDGSGYKFLVRLHNSPVVHFVVVL